MKKQKNRHKRLGIFFYLMSAIGSLAQYPVTNAPFHTWSNIASLVDRDGRLTHEGLRFSTKAYKAEALRLMVDEASAVATAMNLDEQLPICETNLTAAFVLGYGMSLVQPGAIGNVRTKNYKYTIDEGYRFCGLETPQQDKRCIEWSDIYQWPTNRLDRKKAYELATNWLGRAGMDVATLNKDCEVEIEPNKYWNAPLLRNGVFVPVYDVTWISPKDHAKGYGDTAYVFLFAPSETLMSLAVRDPKYILRKPLVFTNLDLLLSQTNSPTQQSTESEH